MNYYRSKNTVLLMIDILAIVFSFLVAIGIRYTILIKPLGSVFVLPVYTIFFVCAIVIYIMVFLVKDKARIEKMSAREIILLTIEQQIIFVAVYVMFFFVFHSANIISRIVVGLFFVGNILFCSIGRIIYHNYCIGRSEDRINTDENIGNGGRKENNKTQHVYILGSKSIGLYGGFESFVMNLLQQHKNNETIKYHVACKANGSGYMDLSKLEDIVPINDREFTYCNAHCFMIDIPEKLGAAQAIYYDIKALKWICDHIEKNHIAQPIVYILASRIGVFEKKYVKRIHGAGGKVYQNPDGHEDWRAKWNILIRKYWKLSERYAVKRADLVICDSVSIEKYIKDEYAAYCPKTEFIAYGSYVASEENMAEDKKYKNWLSDHDLKDGNFYISVGRFVPENNFEVMIREFMLSNTKKDFAIITTDNSKYAKELQQKLNYKRDKRIKFVGTVYDVELLTKIRQRAFGYFHGHEVGGTNPSLLEALGSTDLNLLYDVNFNREVAKDGALYWNKQEGSLASLINQSEVITPEERRLFGEKAKRRIRENYSWKLIADKYEKVFRGL